MQSLKKNWLVVWNKYKEFGEFSHKHSKVQKFHFNGLLLSKLYKVWAKKMQRSYLSWYWTVMQNLKKPDLVVLKMAWGIEWTFIRALKSLKNCRLTGSFCPKHILFQIENFRGKLTCGLKNDIRNLVDFHASGRKSENLHFDRILLSKTCKDLDEKVQKSYISRHWRFMQSLK